MVNLLQKVDDDIDYKKTDISKPITKGELEQGGEELEDEAELEEEKQNEDDIVEEGKMKKQAGYRLFKMQRAVNCSLIIPGILLILIWSKG